MIYTKTQKHSNIKSLIISALEVTCRTCVVGERIVGCSVLPLSPLSDPVTVA